MKLVIQRNRFIDTHNIYIKLFQMHKSYLLLVSDQEEMGIGNVTLSSPPTIEGLNSTAASYGLFGIKEKIISKIIAEKASRILKTPVLLLYFLKNVKDEENIAKELTSFFNDFLDESLGEINQ